MSVEGEKLWDLIRYNLKCLEEFKIIINKPYYIYVSILTGLIF